MSFVPKKFSILIVDDNPRNIQVAAGFLKPIGYHIAFARNGLSALEKLHKKKFDLILLDVMMPDMDGYEVCRRLKLNQETIDIPIIFLTANNDAESVAKAFDVGGIDFLSKPFNASELQARVKTHLNLQHAQEVMATNNTELRENRKKLEEANATKDKFFSIIAHDLRSPFNTLLGFTEYLEKEFYTISSEKSFDMIKQIKKTARGTYFLLENLLEWSRSQTGKMPPKPITINLRDIITDCVGMAQTSANKKHISLRAEISDKLPAYIDENMIRTVIRNLISNAIKFTPHGGEILVGVADGLKYYRVYVQDNGVGIKNSVQKTLFNVDSHCSTMGTDREKGTGLGLILCKEFVEKNGGTIEVESELNMGTRFLFTVKKDENAIVEIPNFDNISPLLSEEKFTNTGNRPPLPPATQDILVPIEISEELKEEFNRIKETYIMGRIDSFADAIAKIGKAQDNAVLVNWSGKIKAATDMFDIEKINQHMQEFERFCFK